jgi:predicted acetyltransferase
MYMSNTIRNYSEKKDKKSVQRIWQECGWLSDSKKDKETLDTFLSTSNAKVYEYGGAAECLVVSTPSRLRYLDRDLDNAAVTAVTTSRIARNLGAASALLADVLRRDAEGGAKVSGLGVFEQGFYNRLGFGSGNYEHWIGFDPAWLVSLPKPGMPRRIDGASWKAIHQARLRRRKAHGAVDLLPPEITKIDMKWLKNSFCLGYKKGNRITHCVVMHADNVESGPYTVDWMAYENLRQFRELLSLIAGLGDQVRMVKMREPREIQMQDFLKKPFQLQAITKSGKFEVASHAVAYWQMRILDLKACLSAMKCADGLRFNLVVADPVERHLNAGSGWKGCAGDYTVSLGPKSTVRKGLDESLDTLTASIGDLTRYWLGIQSAEALNVTGDFDGPDQLLQELDRVNTVPNPAPDWDY